MAVERIYALEYGYCCGQQTTVYNNDHETNKVRGLLCFRCNTGIGSFRENIKFLEQAILYLKEHK